MNQKQQLAAQLSAAFTVKTRTNGENFWCLKDDAPAWATGAVRACHDDGSELPNDWRYQFIVDAANTLAESDDWDDLAWPEADVYNHDLIKWLGEFPNADWYCDESDFADYNSEGKGIMDAIGYGQAYAKQETRARLKAFLEQMADQADVS